MLSPGINKMAKEMGLNSSAFQNAFHPVPLPSSPSLCCTPPLSDILPGVPWTTTLVTSEHKHVSLSVFPGVTVGSRGKVLVGTCVHKDTVLASNVGKIPTHENSLVTIQQLQRFIPQWQKKIQGMTQCFLSLFLSSWVPPTQETFLYGTYR